MPNDRDDPTEPQLRAILENVLDALVATDPRMSVLTMRDESDRWQAERRYRTVFEVPARLSSLQRDDHPNSRPGRTEREGARRG